MLSHHVAMQQLGFGTYQLTDFELTLDEIQAINGLNQHLRVGPNPDNVYQKNGF